MITDFILKKDFNFKYLSYDKLLNGIHYSFVHPTKGSFIALLPDKYSLLQIDSIDYNTNLTFKCINDLIDWVNEN
ncbi:hypothetical protein [Tenacibaculum sp. 190524A02b]|uniref:RES domain-containing protein n=1 Tax=Tenacibaculum vairaonense TaxID=3137860 RepID=A0ABM9PHS0_9FLAO